MAQVNDEDEVTIIDFPQMVSVAHPNAAELFQRDVDGVVRFFRKKLAYMPELDEGLPRISPDFEVRHASACHCFVSDSGLQWSQCASGAAPSCRLGSFRFLVNRFAIGVLDEVNVLQVVPKIESVWPPGVCFRDAVPFPFAGDPGDSEGKEGTGCRAVCFR